MYNSTCFDGTASGKTTTATVAQFLKFDSISIYYNNTLYVTVGPSNAAKFGFTPSDFFKGTLPNFNFASQSYFGAISKIINDQQLSTVDAQLFIAKFRDDYSHLAVTVVDKHTGALMCTMMWTNLNEAVCRLGEGNFIMYGKSDSRIVFRHPINRKFSQGNSDNVAETVWRQIIPVTVTTASANSSSPAQQK